MSRIICGAAALHYMRNHAALNGDADDIPRRHTYEPGEETLDSFCIEVQEDGSWQISGHAYPHHYLPGKEEPEFDTHRNYKTDNPKIK